MKTTRRWLREPLLHFIVLGAALFSLHHWLAPPGPTKQIVLSESVIRGLRQDHLRRTGALPTAEEEAALVQRYVDNEVLYREALALGLDRGDIIVRRRLVQKMEFLTEDLEPIPEATDGALQSYLDAHAERYAVAARVTLTHVFAGTEQHGAEAQAVATRWRDQLVAGADPAGLGDPFLRGRNFRSATERDLAAAFGTSFAEQVMALAAGNWSAPLRSSYGFHIVRVSERSPARMPDLAEVRAAVQRDWQEERRAGASRAALDRLRRGYDIRIDASTATAAASGFPVARAEARSEEAH